ncbi:FAD-dependent pyridine nucleotide-disulfide oxidoreductase [[Leptolyngbya] sp. PCC 7376]|uniref:FAD-dependent oxidoreductase n=1 Tax=[Leptolyngbya] sp. PCC 7376 TaxID=111781 RepID=UPI00029EC655|nr:FAD-dependent oxidoreductase [[Leptolyngbya] sp. PCC 7376]AFY39815.1 FAD-dependent pyridine nucleotide-disulfide oxidoreductase [[Leptolyngbya] sp. PCC 7376]
METLQTKVLVVGGGTGGTAAALQCARNGVETILVSEFQWLGGMLTAAGVAAPDGNELLPWQTGLWGTFLRELQKRQKEGLDHSWVSMFTFDPCLGAEIFAEWVKTEKNLTWISGQVPLEVKKQGDRLTGVRFGKYEIHADIIIDGTELGDILALGDLPHRWGWDWDEGITMDEPSVVKQPNKMTETYPVQSPTWVFYMQENGAKPPVDYRDYTKFKGAWKEGDLDLFMNYGGLPGGKFMLNWPIDGNDYGLDANRLLDPTTRQDFYKDAQAHSFAFADHIYRESNGKYGLAKEIFPHDLGEGSFALMPYFRESRRIIGTETFIEKQLLPDGDVALLPIDDKGIVTVIAIGNYPNDHHYPGFKFPLFPKSITWGGRVTGTPFTLPFSVLIPAETEGLIACEKNIAVSHMANGATRLQPLVMNTGQAAGQTAALAIQNNCSPRNISVRELQEKLLTDTSAPAAVIPFYNLPLEHSEWLKWQRFYLDNPDQYPQTGICPCSDFQSSLTSQAKEYMGTIEKVGDRLYFVQLDNNQGGFRLITLNPEIHQWLSGLNAPAKVTMFGRINHAASWFVLEQIS